MHEKAGAQSEGRKNRKAWVKPQVRRMAAGSAEFGGIPLMDGGGGNFS